MALRNRNGKFHYRFTLNGRDTAGNRLRRHPVKRDGSADYRGGTQAGPLGRAPDVSKNTDSPIR